MKTRQRDPSGTPGLPPAPAPPARDANPWPMSGQGDGAPKLHPRVREAVRKAGGERERAPPVVERPPSAGGQKLAWLPYLMLVFVVATSVRVAIEAFDAGSVEAAIGPLIAILFAAFFVWRRLRRKH